MSFMSKSSPLSNPYLSYLRRHYAEASDEQLAKVLGINKATLTKVVRKQGLIRPTDNTSHEKELPPYTGVLSPKETPDVWERPDTLCAVLAFFITLFIYCLTLPPTITGEDAGELVTAAYTLGIAHPPGYPLWTLLAHLFTYIPFGTVAWRVAFASAFFGAATCSVVYAITKQLTIPRIIGLGVALALGFSQQFWAQSIIAEVYTLNALLITLAFWATLRWYDTHNTKWLYTLAVVAGLGLCNHQTMALMGPVFIVFLLYIDRAPLSRWKTYTACCALAFSMLSLYIYLPIRSAANPPVDWGNPENFENFMEVVTRKQYAFAFNAHERTIARVFGQSWAFLKIYATQFTIFLAWLPLLGLWRCLKRDRILCGMLVGSFIVLSAGFIFATNFDLDHQSLWVNSVFWVPAYFIAALLMGLGIEQLIHLICAPKAQTACMCFALVIITALPLMTHYRSNDKSNYYFAHDYAVNILNTLEPNAVYFPTADHATFPVMYLQSVEGMRPDVIIANKYGYIDHELYADMDFAIRDSFEKIPTEDQNEYIEHWMVDNYDGPAYFTKKPKPPKQSQWKVINDGLTYRMMRNTLVMAEHDRWADYEWTTLAVEDTREELSAEMILSDYYFARGRDWLDENEIDKATESFEQVLALSRDNKETYNNLGSALAEAGHSKFAKDYYVQAIELDPLYDTAIRNLGHVYLTLGNSESSILMFERLIEMGKGDFNSRFVLAETLKNEGRIDDALMRLNQLLTGPGDHASVYKEIGLIYYNEKQDKETARNYFQQSLQLNPNQPDLINLLSLPSDNSEAPNEALTPQLPEIPGGGPEIPGIPTAPNPSQSNPANEVPGLPPLPQLPQTP